MNKEAYINLLKSTLQNIIDNTIITIEEIELNNQFEVFDYIEHMPFPSTVKEHIEKLEILCAKQSSELFMQSEQIKSLHAQLFMTKLSIKKKRETQQECNKILCRQQAIINRLEADIASKDKALEFLNQKVLQAFIMENLDTVFSKPS